MSSPAGATATPDGNPFMACTRRALHAVPGRGMRCRFCQATNRGREFAVA
jgi:hypothetical protein